MSQTLTTITIDRQKVFAYHGLLPQEGVVGAYFYVSVRLEMDDNAAILTDNVDDTVSYADISRIITEEMAVRSRLLEHVANRIKDRILALHSGVLRLTVSITKENPPLGIECRGAGVEVTFLR